jgi:hypothetical protein
MRMLLYLVLRFVRGGGVEGRMSDQHFKQNDAHTPPVTH